MSFILTCILSAIAVAGASLQRTPSWFPSSEADGQSLIPEFGRKLRSVGAAGGAPHCGPLTRELVQRVARESTVLVTVIDKIVWKCFGPSYVENIQAANITYWLIAALDPETSMALGAMGVQQCFNAPKDRLKYKGSGNKYAWGSHHWVQTTWNKVHIMKSVYEMGVHVIHSDADVVWLTDPLPYFMARLSSPVDIIIATDGVFTGNQVGDSGLEVNTSPHININTGVYFMRHRPRGLEFFDVWLSWQGKIPGDHDQDGFNYVTRGRYFRGHTDMPYAYTNKTSRRDRLFYAAYHNATAISFLPASMFGNTYTWVNARLWEKLEHPLYEVHLVWGGSTMESKRQNLRDAMKFHDEPDYYTSPYLVTFDLEQMQTPEGFNTWDDSRTEEMIRFHATAANYQLQQTYYAFAIAYIANRTLVMPRFLCHCSKNWYQTQACRINFETATTFPFVCALSHMMRVKRLEQGFTLPRNTEFSGHKVHIREYSFLENPKVPDHIKKSYLEVVPSIFPRPPGLGLDDLVLSLERHPQGYGRRITVAAPLTDWELRAVLSHYKDVRVVHFSQPNRTLSGFSKPETAMEYDIGIQRRVTTWCCRSPSDMKATNLTEEGIQLVILPPARFGNLPPLEPRYGYLHNLSPLSSSGS